MSACTRGAPLRSAAQHAEAEVDRDRAVPGAGEVDAQVAGAAGQVEHAAAGGRAERAHGPAPPAHVEAERHDPVDEVVARGDGVEHVAHGGALLVALGQRVAVPAGGGRSSAVRLRSGRADARGRRRTRRGPSGDLAGPAVVGLAGRGADDLVDEHDRLRAACSGRCGAAASASSAGVRRVDAVRAAGRWPRPRCPQRSLGRPATTQSYTPGWALTAISTSSAKIFSPPELIVTASRPCSSMLPSARQRARSPGIGVAHAVDDGVRARRLRGVAEVAERQPAALGQPADLVVAGRAAPGRGRRTARGCPARAGTSRSPRRRPSTRATAGRRPPTSRGRRRSSPSAGGRAARCFRPTDSGGAAGQDDVEARQVVVVAVELVERAGGRRRRRRSA